jgi:hypothetical protein
LLEVSVFETWLETHLQTYFPNVCKQMTRKEFERFVRYAIKRARSHGFHRNQEIVRFTNLLALVGPTFDEDVDLPWASQILHSGDPPALRLARLESAAEAHIWGPARPGGQT